MFLYIGELWFCSLSIGVPVSTGCSRVADVVWFPLGAGLRLGPQCMCVKLWFVTGTTPNDSMMQKCVFFPEIPQGLCLQQHRRKWLVGQSTNGKSCHLHIVWCEVLKPEIVAIPPTAPYNSTYFLPQEHSQVLLYHLVYDGSLAEDRLPMTTQHMHSCMEQAVMADRSIKAG